MDNSTFNSMHETKSIRRRRSDCAWKKTGSLEPKIEELDTYYPPGPIDIKPSWNPVNRNDKPPYSYATIIAHAILTSKERKLTLHDIYIWITKNYPYYSNETQGWQNSIRHNLSLHKSFVKIDRDLTSENQPRKGCFWTIRSGREKQFVDNLQKPLNSSRKQHSTAHFLSSKRNQHHHYSTNALYDQIFPNKRLKNLCTTAEIPSTTVSESEPIIVSSSSDHLSSPSSPSISGSPTYHDLLANVPETSTSYNVYPESNAELFSEHNLYHSYLSGNSQGTAYFTDNGSISHPPSLSPCDTYSTTSSFAEMTYHHTSPDFSRLYSNNTHYSKFKSPYYGALKYPGAHYDNKIDWASSSSSTTNPHDTFLQPPFRYHLTEENRNSNHHFNSLRR